MVLSFALAQVLREPPIFEPLGSLGANVARVAMGVGLAVVWLGIWKRVADSYLWRSLRRR